MATDTTDTVAAAANVQALAEKLEAERARLALLGGDAKTVLTETLSDTELAADRDLAMWKRSEERREHKAEMAAQLEAAKAIREANKAIRDADIRDVVDARKALAAQRRADSPQSLIASLFRYTKWTRIGCGTFIGIGMIWSAINVQQNIGPGGASDPLFWASFLVEAMISGLLVTLALGKNKVREAGVEPNAGTTVAEVGLFLLTLGLNTYPYVKAADWYQTGVRSIAPVMIGVTLWVLHALGKDYAAAREATRKRIHADEGAAHVPTVHGDLMAVHTSTVQTVHGDSSTVQTVQAPTVQTVHGGSQAVHGLHGGGAGEPEAAVDTVQTVHSTVHTGSQTVHSVPDIDAATVLTGAQVEGVTEPEPCIAETGTVHSGIAEEAVHSASTGPSIGDDAAALEEDTDWAAGGVEVAADAETVAVDAAASSDQVEEGVMVTAADAEPVAGVVEGIESSEGAAAAAVHGAESGAVSEPADDRAPEQVDTVQAPSTEHLSADTETVHRALVADTAREHVHAVQHTVQRETVQRAPERATGEHTVDGDADLWALAAEVHSRLERTGFDVATVATVLIANRRQNMSAWTIYRNKIGPHPDVTRKWFKLAEQIEAEGTAVAPVIELRKA